jgi:hypothetical protein
MKVGIVLNLALHLVGIVSQGIHEVRIKKVVFRILETFYENRNVIPLLL